MKKEIRVVMVNGFQEADDENQWYNKSFFLMRKDDKVEEYNSMGCAYQSSLEEAERYGIKYHHLLRGRCDISIYSKKDGIWV